MQRVASRRHDTVKSIYILGPMSGYPNFNFEAFNNAANKLRAEGWVVFNPVDKDAETGVKESEAFAEGSDKKLMAAGWDFRDAYGWDLDKVVKANAVYCLKGWEFSHGARGEWSAAVSMKARYPEYQIIYE